MIFPGLLGYLEFTFAVTQDAGGRATALEIDAVIRAEPTQELLASGCAVGAVDSTAEYVATPAIG